MARGGRPADCAESGGRPDGGGRFFHHKVARKRDLWETGSRRETRRGRRKEARRVLEVEFAGGVATLRKHTPNTSGSSGIIVDGEDCREIVERYLENGECANIRPPPRGGCWRKMACGLRVRSGREGRRGEYCGGASMQASAGSIRRGVVSFIAGAESHLPRRPSAVLPPSRPLPLVFCHASAFHSWPRHPPLGGGRVLPPFLLLAFVEFHGWFLKIPRSTGNAELSMFLAGTRRRMYSRPCHMRKD